MTFPVTPAIENRSGTPEETALHESALGRAYRVAYSRLCGEHPNVYPWHFQWLAGKYLYASLRKLLPGFSGKVLDAGCGEKPYRSWFGATTEYVGLDVFPGKNVDVLVDPSDPWPLPSDHFDVLLSSQVLEHVEHLDLTLGEMARVVKEGGSMLLTFPFIYNEHGAPNDFQRFTAFRAAKLMPGFEVVRVERQGGIGSTVVQLVLNWVDDSLNATKVGRILKAPLLPLWIIFCFLMNLAGLFGDLIDRTGSFYSNLLVVLRKTSSRSGLPAA
jgi:SAM-dependent methyltransferase